MSQQNPRICILGAGMSGMLMAIKLKNAGYTNFVIYEKAAKVGGTWRENRYPGVACDVASFSYCYAFEPNPDWSRRFSPGPEIQKYFERVAEKYCLHPYIRFNTTVTSAVFKDKQWHVETHQGDVEVFDFYVAASGPLNKKKYPDIKGLETFAGKMFHTADWDDSYDFKDKLIGLIGTGSSAVQSVGPLSDIARKLSIFQRTAQWVIGTPNPYYTPLDKKLKHWFPLLGSMTRKFYDWVGEQFGRAALANGWHRKLVFMACDQSLNGVKDSELRRKLTPADQPMCKRMIMSDTFYPAVQRSHVELVVEGIDHIEPRGIVTIDGRLHELDLLVLATGFYPNAWGVNHVVGEGGRTLEEVWNSGTRSYRSITLPGFPNYFMLIGPNSPITNLSLIDIADIGVDYILQCIKKFERGEFVTMMPKVDVTRAFTETLKSSFGETIWVSGCNSWYLDAEGVPATWPWAPSHFRASLKTLDLADYDLG